MKKMTLAILGILLLFNFAHARETEPFCFDPSAALPKACENGKSLFIFKGQCADPSEVEGFYCAYEEMTNVKVVEDETQLNKTLVRYQEVLLVESNQTVLAEPGMASNCKNAFVVIGQPKAIVDSLDPSENPINISNLLLDFACNN